MRNQAWFLGLAMIVLAGACTPPSSRETSIKEQANAKLEGPYSDQNMTRMVLEIEAALGSDRIVQIRSGYQQTFQGEPDNPYKRFLWAYSLDDRNEAWAELAKITKMDDRFYWVYLGMATILRNWKVLDQAEMNFKKAISLSPETAIGAGRLGSLYLQQGKYSEAANYLRDAIKKDPDQMTYLIDLARVLQKDQKMPEAEQIYLDVIKKDPTNFVAFQELAELTRARGDQAKALEYYSRAAELNPDAYEVRVHKGELLAELMQEKEALLVFRETCALRPEGQPCWQTLAGLAGKLGEPDIQMDAYEHVAKIDPANLEANKAIGKRYFEAGEVEKALPAFLAVVEKEKDNVTAWQGLASIYEQGGEFSKAIECNETLIRLDPKNQYAGEALARLFKQFYILPDPISGKTPQIILSLNREKIAEVYKFRLREKASLKGEMIIRVVIDNEGQVLDVIMEKNTVGDAVLDICAIWNIRRSKFPKSFGAAYQFELTLSPGK